MLNRPGIFCQLSPNVSVRALVNLRVLPAAAVPAAMLPNPRLGGLAKHHPANAGKRQHDGHNVGLAQAFRQQAQRAGHAPGAAD